MVGMLTFHELLRCRLRGGALGEVKVADIMLRNPVTAAPDMEVNDLRRTMIDTGARYLPVMQDGRLIGVISFRDVAKAVLEEQDFENKMLKGYIKNWPELSYLKRRNLLLGAGAALAGRLFAAWRYWPEQGSGIPATRGCRAGSPSTTCAPRGTASTPRSAGQPLAPHRHRRFGSGIFVNPATDSLLNPGQYARRLFFLNAGCVHDARRASIAPTSSACAT